MKRPSSSLAGTVHGPYRIEELIASGGMGQVYRAHDTRLQRAVAVKAIHPHFVADGVARQRFLRETRLACRVSHPYVASVFDVLEADGQPLLVLEYIEGRTLSRVLREERPDPSQVWLWLIEIVDALVAIHRAGVVHRDLKPGNVMITTDGHVKVMDFGLSRVDTRVDPGSDSSTLTQHATLTRDGAVLGTLLYASPEQLRGQTPDRRSDLFSLGILMYEGLKGVHPFGRRTGPESVSAILHDGPAGGVLPPLLREDGRVQALLDRLLAKAPEQRHADAKTVLQELRAMPGTSGFAEAIPAPRWRPWKVLVPVVLLAGLLPVAGIWWLKRPPVWDAPRIALALAPFVDETQTFEGRVAASMVADLLAVDLQASQLVRAEGPEETQLLLRSLPADLQPREIATRLTTGLSVDYVASGRLYREGSEYLAAVEFEPCKAGLGEIPAFTASGATPLLLAERLASGLRRRLPEVPRLTAMRDDRIDLSEITSASERARNLLAQGVLAQRAEQLTEAIRLYRRAVEADSSFALGFARLAGVLNQVGYGRLAREAADSARALAPEPSSRARHRLALLIRATWAEAFERPGERVEAARELAEMFPDEPAMLHAYARALAASERYTEALELIDRALVLDARNLALRLARADLLRLCHRPEEALQALEEIEGLFQLAGSDEGWAAVTRLRGRVRHAQERSADAAEILGNAAERFSAAGRDLAAAETWLEVVNIDLELGKLDAADARIAQALTLAEKVGNRGLVAEALATRAVLHQLRRDYDGATRLYQESIDIGRQLERSSLLAGPVSNLSSLLVWLGRVDEARPLLERAVEIATELKRPDMLQVALINSAEIEFQLGRLDEATRYYETLLQSGSGEEPTRLATFAHLGLAAIHRHRGRLGRALGVLDGAIVEYEARGMKLELGRALLNRARTQSLLSRDDAARSDIDRAAAVADEFPELRSSVDLVRAEMSLHRGDWQRGLHAVSVHPDRDHHPSLLVAACRANLELGRFQPALEACRAALALPDYPAPERTAARALLAEALWRAGNPQAAAELARATLSEARRMDLPLERALAGTVLATADRGSKNASVSCRDALSSLQTYVAGAPAEDRASLKKRPDLLRIERTLSACETRNPRGGE